MNRDGLEEGLSEAGLSEYERRAYLTVLELGSASATDIAERADVPRSRVYDVLRDLEDDGYVETYEQDSLHARARDPGDVFERLKERAETLERTAEEIQDRWQQAEIGGHRVSYVKRQETVIERAKSAISEAKNRVQLSSTPEQFDRLSSPLRSAYEDGVFVSVSFNTSPERPTPLPDEGELAGVVTEARHRDIPAPFLLLVDHDVVCFTPHTSPVDQYGIIVEDRELLYVFRWYFRAAAWEAWPTIHTARSDSLPAEYVDIRECIRDISPLLAEGASVTARVRGTRTERRSDYELEGEIVDIVRSQTVTDVTDDQHLSNLAGRAAIVLETDDGEVHSIGGTGASLEDIEAYRIRIQSIDSAGDAA